MIFSRCLTCICLLITFSQQSPGILPSTAFIEADLDRDGRMERVALNPGADLVLAISRGKRLLWQGVPKRWKPWKLRIADVDGDGRPEIALGIYKSTHYI